MARERINRADWAYRRLVEDILRGRWEPDQTVSAHTLAARLAMSRTPVVEALKRLEGDGLIEIVPQVGCRLVTPPWSAVEELFALWGALEGIAAEQAAHRIAADQLQDLAATLEQLDAAAERQDDRRVAELHLRFHLQVVAAAGMTRLLARAERLQVVLRVMLAMTPSSPDVLRRSMSDHREIHDALRARTSGRARSAVERHAHSLGRHLAAGLRPAAAARAGAGLMHSALLYDSDDDWLAAAAPFLTEGLEAGERVLAVATGHKVELLEDALGAASREVELRDSPGSYGEPASALRTYQEYIAEHGGSRRVRVLGEPPWSDLSDAGIRAWTRYESVVNVALALAPATLMCAYDRRALPPAILEGAARTHPFVCTRGATSASKDYSDFFAAPGLG